MYYYYYLISLNEPVDFQNVPCTFSLVPNCALVATAVFAAAFSFYINSFENAEVVTYTLPRQNTTNFNWFWEKYHLFSDPLAPEAP